MDKLSSLKNFLAIGALIMAPVVGMAQSYEFHNTTESIGGIWTSGERDVIIGPNANITVNGDWYITADSVYINPTAQIGGTGTIHLMNTNTSGFSATANPTKLDGGGITIGCKVSIENTQTVQLTMISVGAGASYPASGITDNGAAAGSNNLKLANNLNFNNVGAHLVLNTDSLILTSAAAAIVTYNDLNTAGFVPDPTPGPVYSAYVVTNGTNPGVMMKQGVAASASFTFPIGQSGPSASPYDYTPATITNTGGGVRAFSVRVQSYANSSPMESNLTHAMNRTWQISSDISGSSTLALTHNDVTNPQGVGTSGAAFDPTHVIITQQLLPNAWSHTMASQNGGTPVNTVSGTFTLAISGSGTYFTKTSDTVNTVNPILLVEPMAFLQGPFSGGVMTTTLNSSGIIPLSQPYNIAPFGASGSGYAGSETVSAIPSVGIGAQITDWVLVELRNSATPATIVATRAAFIKSNDSIVDLDGRSAVAFATPVYGDGGAGLFTAGNTYNYYVSIRHRNHLGIRSTNTIAFLIADPTVPVVYNFTTPAGQANGTNAQIQIAPGVYAMWSGNTSYGPDGTGHQVLAYSYPGVTSDVDATRARVVNATGNISHNPAFIGSSVTNVYDQNDVNLDGKIRYSAPPDPSDVDAIIANVVNWPTNISKNPAFTNAIEQLP